jgi:penicillin amidase
LYSTAVLQQIVESGAAGWFKDLDQTLVRCLSDAVAEGSRSQGANVSRWRYGHYNELTIKHPIGNEIPVVGRFFNIGPVEMSGSSTTVKQTTRRLGPSMRFVADLSSWDQSLHNLTIGESGQILSSHYKDQWDAYYAGTSFPMQFDHVDAKATLTVVSSR